MIYRFVIISDEVDDFRRDIRISASATFLQLHDAILDAVGYESSQITSFTICDEEWEPTHEVAMIDECRSMEEDVYLMGSTSLDELLTEERQKLLYFFDVVGNRSFFIELREITLGAEIDKPEVVRSKGNPPKQESNIDELLAAPVVGAAAKAHTTADLYDGESDFYSDNLDIDSLADLEAQGLGIQDDLF